MDILFFISHQANPRFVKQINFLAKTNTVSLAHFQRNTLPNLDSSIDSRVIRTNFGEIPNASKPLKRIWTYIKTIKNIKKLIKANEYDVVLVNNLDVLLLYLFSRSWFFRKKDTTIAIEISDLREYVFGIGFAASTLQFLERVLYKKHIDKLIVTSEKYYTHHFKKFYKKDVFVLENKLLSREIKITDREYKKDSSKTVIGIVGMLLRRDEYIKLFETYKESQNIEIHVYGKGEYQELVKEYANKYSNISYFGPYNAFTDTQRIYSSIDIIYLIYDIHQVSLNNRLALPNKLYECMYYGVPLLCSKNTYLAEKVKEHGLGAEIDYMAEGEIESGVNFLMENLGEMKEHFKTLDKNLYLGDNDYIRLECFLME